MAKAASPVRLQQPLMDAAMAAAGPLHRSAAEQIEYWADLGRRVAGVLDPLKLAEVASGLAHLRVEPAIAPPLSAETVFAEVERQRQTGELTPAVTSLYPRYQSAPTHPGYLEQISADGTRTIGSFHNGIFTPLTD